MGETVELMERIGAYLRRERESRGLSLDEVSQQTKIQRIHLDAIERDDFSALPAGPFVSGFVATYARMLGLKPDSVLAMLPQDEDSAAAFIPERTEADRRAPRMEIRELPVGGSNRGLMVWVIVALVILAAVTALLLWQMPAMRGWLGLGVVDRLTGAVAGAGIPGKPGAAGSDAAGAGGASGASSGSSKSGHAGREATSSHSGEKAGAEEAKSADEKSRSAKSLDGKGGEEKLLAEAGVKNPREPGDSSRTSSGTAPGSATGSASSHTGSGGASTAGGEQATALTTPQATGGAAGRAGAAAAVAVGSAANGSSSSRSAVGAAVGSGKALETSSGGIQRLASIESEIDKQAYQVFANPGRTGGKPQVINVTAQSKTYLRVSSALDGTPVYEGVLKGGDRKEFQSQNDLWMIVGNGGGVEVYYDGHPLPAPGRYGERVGLAFRVSAGH